MTYNPDIPDLAYHLHTILERHGKITIEMGKPINFDDTVYSVSVENVNDNLTKMSCTTSDLLTALKGIMRFTHGTKA